MRIAIASGKGGTGKTTIATGLAISAAEAGEPASYVDCDVEEPNGHIYLKPVVHERVPATTAVPRIDPSLCTVCRRCAEVCRFGALAIAGGGVLTFDELCHACGACGLVCPTGAISEEHRETGVVKLGRADGIGYVGGLLTVGEAMPLPVLRSVIERIPETALAVLDAPPGTSCPVVETLSAADAVVLVVEPTPFGLHDFHLAAELVRELGLPAHVVINKDDGSERGHLAAAEAGFEVLAAFRDDRAVAEMCSRGDHPVRLEPEYAARMNELRRVVTTAHARRGSE